MQFVFLKDSKANKYSFKIDTKGPKRPERVKCQKSSDISNTDRNVLNKYFQNRFNKNR